MDRLGPAQPPAVERRAWESAARACYRQIGVPFPERVVWVSSPLVGAFVAPIATCLATGHRNRHVLESVYRAVDSTAGETVGQAVRAGVQAAADGAVGDPVHGPAAAALYTEITEAMDAAKTSAMRDSDPATPSPAPRPGVLADDMTMLTTACDTAVRTVVEATVGPRQDTIRGAIRRLWRARPTDRAFPSWLTLVNHYLEATEPSMEDQPERSAAEQAAADLTPAGWWWWPFREFVVFATRPVELHLEHAGDPGHGRHRPHRADGPAVAWSDGFGLCYWHGTPVPRAVIDDTLTTDEILREPNVEVRRCAIERRGWDRFVAEARLTQVGPTMPDPGNPGQALALYDVPEGIYTTHVRVLLCTNGTVERDGSRRRFGLVVPASCADPIQAAAWTYGLTADQYATAQRRT